MVSNRSGAGPDVRLPVAGSIRRSARFDLISRKLLCRTFVVALCQKCDGARALTGPADYLERGWTLQRPAAGSVPCFRLRRDAGMRAVWSDDRRSTGLERSSLHHARGRNGLRYSGIGRAEDPRRAHAGQSRVRGIEEAPRASVQRARISAPLVPQTLNRRFRYRRRLVCSPPPREAAGPSPPRGRRRGGGAKACRQPCRHSRS